MKTIRHVAVLICLLYSIGAAAQDSIGNDDFIYLDTIATTPAETDAAENGDDDGLDLEGKVRKGKVQHWIWDEQVPGQWSDAAQNRLSIREVPAGTLQQLRDMKALQYRPPERAAPNWASRTWLWIIEHLKTLQQILFWLLGALLLAVIIFFIRKNDIPLFRWEWQTKEKAPLQEGPGGKTDYEALARAAIAAGNFREAVRMRYLQTLQTLELRQLIAPGKDKTNMDYLRELAPTGWHQPFAHLTRHYEYVWYGKLPLTNGQFTQLDEKFTAFNNALS